MRYFTQHGQPRIRCCVLRCHRSCKSDGRFHVWICGRHWRSVDRGLRDRHKAMKRETRRLARRGWPMAYSTRDANRCAAYAVVMAETAAFLAIVQDATIKEIMNA